MTSSLCVPVDLLGAAGVWEEPQVVHERRWAVGGLLVALAAIAGAIYLDCG